MKKLFIFILLFVSINNYSQVRLNRTIESIQKEFKQYPQKVENNVLKVYDKKVIISYYFENKICTKVILSTKSASVANLIINQYTKDYEKIGNTEWIMSSPECGYAHIILKYSQDYYEFIWN